MIDTTCATVRLSDGLIINIIVAQPSDLAPDGCQLVEVMNGQVCNIGWYCVAGEFKGPRTFATCRSDTGEVVSLTTASYVSPAPLAPEGYQVVEVREGVGCEIGWTWGGEQFTAPVA